VATGFAAGDKVDGAGCGEVGVSRVKGRKVKTITRRTLAQSALGVSLAAGPVAAVEPNRQRPAGQEIWQRTELYFGTTFAGGEVSDEEFALFVDQVVTPLFPDGLTLLTGYGQFLGSDNVLIKERSKVLILFYPVRAESNRNVQEIRRQYKERYRQESVLRVDSVTLLSF
jgi:hypothetical protein